MKNKEVLHAYVRVSTQGQVVSSVPEQIEDAREKAAQLNMKLELYADKGISASEDDNISNRPEMQRLLENISDGKVKHLYTEDSTRLSREDAASGIIFGRIKKYGVILYFKNGQGLNLQNPLDDLQAGILDKFAQYDGNIRKMRFEMGLKQASRKGRYVGPNPPYGYDKDSEGYLIINEDEKDIYISIVKQFLSGDGTYTIANRLNANGVPTRSMKKGKSIKWNAGTIASILKNTVYSGLRTYKDIEIEVKNPIIDQRTFDLVQKQFEKNRIHSKRHNTVHKYLLRGLIRCGCEDCGQNYFGKIKENRGERLYCCLSKRTGYKACSNKNINLDRIDNAVWCILRHTPHFYKSLHDELNEVYNEMEIKKGISKLEHASKRLEKEYERLLNKMMSMSSEAPEKALEAIDKLLLQKEKEMNLTKSDLDKLRSKLASKSVNPIALIDKKYVKNGAVDISDPDDRIRFAEQLIDQIILTYHPEKKVHQVNLDIKGHDRITFHLPSTPYKYRQGKELNDDPYRYANENGIMFTLGKDMKVNMIEERFDGLI